MPVDDQTSSALNEILLTLRDAVPGVRGALVATPDGHPITCDSPSQLNEQQLAALAATAFRLAERFTLTMGDEGFTRFSMNGPQADVYLYGSGTKAVLAILTDHNTNLPLLHMEARDAAQAVALLI